MPLYEYSGYFAYELPQASIPTALQRTPMAHAAPAAFWLAYVPNAWDSGLTKSLTCLLCNKVVQWLPYHQNGDTPTKEHAQRWRQLSFTSGTYYAMRRMRAELHPEGEAAPEAQNATPLTGWTSHIQEGTGKMFFYHDASQTSVWELPPGAVPRIAARDHIDVQPS